MHSQQATKICHSCGMSLADAGAWDLHQDFCNYPKGYINKKFGTNGAMSETEEVHPALGQVHVLDSATFKPFIESVGKVLISVILPMTDRCQRFILVFQQIAHTMRKSGIRFAQLDALENNDICVPFEILQFPHVMLFHGFDDVRTYHGAFNEADIVGYLNRLSFPTISTISETSLEDFKNSNDVVVVAYLAADDKDSFEAFSSLAEAMREDYLFGISNDMALAKAEQIDTPGIAVYKNFDEGKRILPLEMDVNLMRVSLRTAARPLVMDFVSELHEDYLDIGAPLGYLFVENPEERARLRKFIEPLAKKHRHEVQFGIANPSHFTDIINDLHLRIERLPAFAIREPVTNLRFPLNDSRSLLEEEIGIFVQDFLSGKLQPTIKSEPIPENNECPLLHVVAFNYHQIVMDSEKDVFLEFCIDNCYPCDMLLPTLEKLAWLYATNPKLKSQITIGTINIDANDVPDRGLQGFPTMKLYPAGSKNAPIFYDGTRTLKRMADFIRDHGKHQAEVPGIEEEQTFGDAMTCDNQWTELEVSRWAS